MNRRMVISLAAAGALAVGLIVYSVYQSLAEDSFRDCAVEITLSKSTVKVGEPLVVTAKVTNHSWHPRVITMHEAIQRSLILIVREGTREVGWNRPRGYVDAPPVARRRWLMPNDQITADLTVTFSLDKFGRYLANYYGKVSGSMTRPDHLKICVQALPFAAFKASAVLPISNAAPITVTP